MDFQAFRETIARIQSSKFTPRQKRLNALSRFLRRKQYQHISVPFSQEREGNAGTGKRILLDNRRAAVQDPLAVELVRDQCGLLFGEDHRPTVLCRDDENTTKWISAFLTDTKFWLTMANALWKGSVGSCAVVLRVLGKQSVKSEINEETGLAEEKTISDGPGHYYFEVWSGEECKPVFDRANPDRLAKLERVWFIGEDALRAQGYDFDALKLEWDKKNPSWRQGSKKVFQRAGGIAEGDWAMRLILDSNSETWYQPVPKFEYERTDWKESDWTEDPKRTFQHDLDQTPAEWVVLLPIDADEYYPDGACLFEPVIDFSFRIDRTLSQTGRAFDYAGDPQMARIRGQNAMPGGAFGVGTAVGGSASDMIDLDEKGEAKFVEITGEGLKVAIETYVRVLEDIAKRAGAMSRIIPESSTGASAELSSVAMRLLNTAQLTLSGILRITCGESPGENILRLAMKMFKDLDVELPSLAGKKIKPNPAAALEWQWPDYYEPIGQEKLFEVQAITTAKESGGISTETMIANLGPLFDISNVEDEKAKIEDNQTTEMAQRVMETDQLSKVADKYTPATGATKNGATPSGKKK